QRQRRLHGFIANRSHRGCKHIECGVCSQSQRRSGEIETLAAKHQQKKIGMCPREAHIAASNCLQPCRRRIALANMSLHHGPKSREADRGEIALRMAERMRAAGCQVELEIWPRMPHTWQVWARVLPEARAAIKRIGAFVQSKVEPQAVR